MLEKIKNPYRVSVSEKARVAGLIDRRFPNKKAALNYVKQIRVSDPEYNPGFQIIFRYIDTATGELYANRTEYELEQERWKILCLKRDGAKTS